MSYSTVFQDGHRVIHALHRSNGPGRERIGRAVPAASFKDLPDLAMAEREGLKITLRSAWNAIRSIFLWIDAKSREAHYRRVEAYLAESCDHAELEQRMRDMNRRNLINWTDCGSR